MQFIFEHDVDDVVLVRPSTMNPSLLGMGRDLMNLSFSWNLLAFFISLGP